MCGIVGRINFDRERPVEPRLIRRMADSLRHRGPDDAGVWTDGAVGLGHRRLSIIDLSPNGHNPMCNEDGTIWITFNGEIYNFLELRPELEKSGHHFRSNTDTEVILHLYEELGTQCVKKLRGMFAFAIWDSRSQRLLLARDRLGVKPLYYSQTASTLLFASEIKALLNADEIEAVPDSVSIHQFLVWQCIPSPRTAFQGIQKLPPASILTCVPGHGTKIEKYWHLEYSHSPAQSEDEISEEVRSRVQEATNLRLVADVPLGIFLSGGVDSACVVAAARKASPGNIQTFSVTFGDDAFDESKYARLVAQHFHTEHHEFHVTPKVMEMLPQMAGLFDEPFADLAAIPTLYLSQLTREHVKVALSGDGGDEAFGGYQRYLALRVLGWISKVPASNQLSALRKLIPYDSGERSRMRYVREMLALVSCTPVQRYRAMLLGMQMEDDWISMYSSHFRQGLDQREHCDSFLDGWNLPAPDDLSRAMASDTLGYIPECLNVKTDIASMACGLEVRSPFLDQKLVEFCARIPSRLKIKGLRQKHVLKRAFRDELPQEVLHRGKAGFGMPLASWLRGDLRACTEETLLAKGNYLSTLIPPERIRLMLAEHMAGTRNWHIQLWRLLVLENWSKSRVTRSSGQKSVLPPSASLRTEVGHAASLTNAG